MKYIAMALFAMAAIGVTAAAFAQQPLAQTTIDLPAAPASKPKPAAPDSTPASDSGKTVARKPSADKSKSADSDDEQFTPIPTGKPTAMVLRGLDKITGRPTDIVAPMNVPVKFATLTITARTCYSTPPTEPPETTAFLQIEDHRPDQSARQVFSGWMFSSTPSLNGMQHPLYDVWVISCKMNQPGVVASVAPVKGPAKAVSPNAGADEEMPDLPEGAGQ